MLKRFRWVLIAVAAIAVFIVLRMTLFRTPPIEVETAVIGRGVVEDAVMNSQAGTVRSRRRSRLGVERAGRVAAIPHREGSRVKSGEVLLELDTSTARVSLEAAERDRDAARAALAGARASSTLAASEFERVRQLRERDVVSQEDLDASKSRRDATAAEADAAEARVGSAESAMRLARDEIDHLRVRAPYDGVVNARLVEVGESVIPGQPVLELTSLDRLYVSAPIDEIDIGRLAQGLPARVTLDPYPGISWRGEVTRVSDVVDDLKEQNRTLEVEVEVVPEKEHPEPKPGTSADIQIILDRRENVLRVPTFALAEGKRVLLLEKGKAVSRDVEAGLKNWEWTEIRGGLAAGDVVITNLDKQGVKAGARVAARATTGGGRDSAGTASAGGS
jgi:HlyD family secretion protein